MRNHAFDTAAAAVVRIDICVRFATVRGCQVTITIGLLAIRNPAGAVYTNCRTVRLIGALGSATAAVIDALFEVDFAAVSNALVAVVEAAGAGNAALAAATGGRAVRAVARHGATAAVGRFRLQIRFAAIASRAIAICNGAARARGNCTGSVSARGRGVSQVTRAAATAMSRVGRLVRFTPVTLVAVTIAKAGKTRRRALA